MSEKKCKPVGISIDPDIEALLDKLQCYLNNTMFAAAPLNKSAVYRMCLRAGAAIMESKAAQWERSDTNEIFRKEKVSEDRTADH